MAGSGCSARRSCRSPPSCAASSEVAWYARPAQDFLPPGAEAFKRDIPDATVRFFDTGHFALETHAGEIAATIREFLARSNKAR